MRTVWNLGLSRHSHCLHRKCQNSRIRWRKKIMTDKIVMIIPTPLGTLIEVHLCNGFYLNLTTGYVRAKHTHSLERIKNKHRIKRKLIWCTQIHTCWQSQLLAHWAAWQSAKQMRQRGRGRVWKERTEGSKASLWYKGHLLFNAGSKNVLWMALFLFRRRTFWERDRS